MSSLRNNSMRPRHPVLGAVGATLVLLAVLLSTLLIHGPNYFEWGFGTSLALAWLAVAVGYMVGGTLVYFLWWISSRAGLRTRPSLVLLGILVALTMWVGTEVSPLADLGSRLFSWVGALAVAILISAAVTVALGYRKRAQ